MCAIIPAAGQQTHGTVFRVLKVTSQVAAQGAESAVYDCLVVQGSLQLSDLSHTLFIIL